MKRLVVPFILMMLAAACATPAAPPTSSSVGNTMTNSAPTAPAAAPSRTLQVAIRVEPEALSSKAPHQGQTTFTTVRRLFAAELAIIDDGSRAQPFLAESLPQLNTDTWRISTDGKMETVYRLRPGLTWHDGAPLTANDFVFAWRAYLLPGLGQATLTPQGLMEEVSAPDPRTLVIRWAKAYPDAGILNIDFPPQPAHILTTALEQGADAYASHPYWTREFVGAGPYRLTRWEPGAFIEGEAFAGYVLGRPKIDRVRVIFVGDPNVAVTTMLAGETHLLADVTVRSQQIPFLQRDWIPKGGGSVLLTPLIYRSAHFQFRRELVSPNGFLDLRVRRALAHATDKQAVNDAIYDGALTMVDHIVPPAMWFAREVDQVTTKYPYDPRRTDQLMAEAGYTRGSDGTFTHPTDGRFRAELRTNASAQFETEMHVVADGWRRAGFDFSEAITPAAQVTDGQVRATFTGAYIYGFPVGFGDTPLRSYSTKDIPGPDNRWIGSNRGAWINADWDRLAPTYDGTLDVDQRARIAIQLARIYSEEVPAIPLEFDPDVIAHVAALVGPRSAPPAGAVAWNIHQWELK